MVTKDNVVLWAALAWPVLSGISGALYLATKQWPQVRWLSVTADWLGFAVADLKKLESLLQKGGDNA